MGGYLIEWADAAGRADVALTPFCPTLPQAYRLADHPSAALVLLGQAPLDQARRSAIARD